MDIRALPRQEAANAYSRERVVQKIPGSSVQMTMGCFALKSSTVQQQQSSPLFWFIMT
jgi:hypothetical protein